MRDPFFVLSYRRRYYVWSAKKRNPGGYPAKMRANSFARMRANKKSSSAALCPFTLCFFPAQRSLCCCFQRDAVQALSLAWRIVYKLCDFRP